MPRGIYPRKKKDGTTAPVAAKSAPVKKTPAVKAKAKVETKSSPAKAEKAVAVQSSVSDAQLGFSILGANLSTLSEAYSKLEDSNQGFVSTIGKEIHETVKAMTTLRESVFGTSASEAPAVEAQEEAPAENEIVAPPPAPPAPAPVAAPTLPIPTAPALHGNAAPFQPPAPPSLTPNH